MAKVGAPKGNTNAASGRECRAALLHVLKNKTFGKVKKAQALRAICEKLVTKAIDGDMTAIREVMDRVDGKPPQALTGDDGGPVEAKIKISFE